MQVKDVMTPTVEIAAPTMSIREAAERMRELDIGCLPVGENDRLVGIVTDRDIVLRAVAAGRDPDRATVRDCMTQDIVWCYDDVDVSEAAELMEQEQIRRLTVINHDKRLCGIVTLGDLSVRSGDRTLAGEITREVSQPGHLRH